MRRFLALLLVAVALALAPGVARAQTGSISGVVVSVDSQAQPITRAIVTLSGGNIPDNLSTVTDPAGRFRFQNLGPGRYSIAVTKAAYLPMNYGATRTGRPGTPIALAAGQNLDVTIPLPRGAVITGTVRDQSGLPAPGVQITVSPSTTVTAASGFRLTADVLLTDDRGVYRAYGLLPDEYVVAAVPRMGNGEVLSLSRAEIDTRLRQLEQRTGGASPGSTSSQPAPEPQRLSFAPTFHPGTSIASHAGRVRVAAGEERMGVDISLVPVRAARISGTIQSGDIAVQRLRPSLTVMGPPQPGIFSPTLTGPSADGAFSFANVTPGHYSLVVRSGPGAPMALEDGRNGTTTDNPNVAARFAVLELDVDGTDIEGVVLTLRPSIAMSGRVEFQGATKPPANNFGVSIVMSPTGPGTNATLVNGALAGGTSPPRANVREDGTFQVVGITPGMFAVSTFQPTGWRLRSVIVNGRDLLDSLLQVDGSTSDFTDAVVTFVDVRSELAGSLTTVSGQPASEFTVLAFTSDRTLWRPGARRIKTARPGSDGAFSIMDLPAGEYLIAALTDFDPRDLQDPAFLEQIIPAAIKVTVIDGQKVRQDLRIAR